MGGARWIPARGAAPAAAARPRGSPVVRAVLLAATVAGSACGGGSADAPDAGAGPAADSARTVATDAVLHVAWSPDTSRLAVTWDRGRGPRLFGLFPGTSSEPAPPTRGLPLTHEDGRHATWSPDRRWVAFESARDGNPEIYRIRPDGTGPERLTAHPGADREPSFSPDGRRIAFVSEREGEGLRLHVMDADGEDVRRVPFDAGAGHASPAWAPDGRRLVVTAREDGADVLWLVDPATGASGRLAEGSRGAWAPDGRRIYYDQNDSIFWRPADGGLRRFVVADGRAPVPAPDGARVAFLRGRPPAVALYVVELETGTEARLTP